MIKGRVDLCCSRVGQYEAQQCPRPHAGVIQRDVQHRGLHVLGSPWLRSVVGQVSATGDVLCNGSVTQGCRASVSSRDLAKHLKYVVNLMLEALSVPLTLHFLFFLFSLPVSTFISLSLPLSKSLGLSLFIYLPLSLFLILPFSPHFSLSYSPFSTESGSSYI